jgi:hypothetical protein
MAKIIGFSKVNGKFDGYKTRLGILKNSRVFMDACNKVATRLELPLSALATKRQAGKFSNKEGLVYNTLYGGGSEKG